MARNLCAGMLLLLFATMVHSQEMPQRKAGMWQMQMSTDAPKAPGNMQMEQCIDERTDAEMQKSSLTGGPGGTGRCEVKSQRKTATGMEMETVCKHERSTVTTRAVMSGDFQSAYTMDMRSHFDPPQAGVADNHTVMKMRYLGPCKAGMSPGDMMVNGMKIPRATVGAPSGGMPKMSEEDMKKMMDSMKNARP